jgi:hypothetical protein
MIMHSADPVAFQPLVLARKKGLKRRKYTTKENIAVD